MSKSTLAARFASLRCDHFSSVWCVTAGSVTAIDNGVADLAVTFRWRDVCDLRRGWRLAAYRCAIVEHDEHCGQRCAALRGVASDPLLKALEPWDPVLVEHEQLPVEGQHAAVDGVGQLGEFGERAGQGTAGTAVDGELMAARRTTDRQPSSSYTNGVFVDPGPKRSAVSPPRGRVRSLARRRGLSDVDRRRHW